MIGFRKYKKLCAAVPVPPTPPLPWITLVFENFNSLDFDYNRVSAWNTYLNGQSSNVNFTHIFVDPIAHKISFGGNYPGITNFYCRSSGIIGYENFHLLPNLKKLDFALNRFRSFVSSNPTLDTLTLTKNALETVDLTIGNIRFLYLSDNMLTTLNLNSQLNMYSVQVSRNQLTKLEMNLCTGLFALWCENNKLAAINVSTFPKLDYLRVSANPLTALNLSQNVALATLLATECQLTALDVSNTKLRLINLANNLLPEITGFENLNIAASSAIYLGSNRLTLEFTRLLLRRYYNAYMESGLLAGEIALRGGQNAPINQDEEIMNYYTTLNAAGGRVSANPFT